MHRIILALCALSFAAAHAAEDFSGWKFMRTIGPEELRVAGSVHSLQFSSDGKTLLSASADGTVRIWDSATGREIRRFNPSASEVMAAVFAPDGESVFTAGRDGLIRMYDLASGVQLRAFPGDSFPALLAFAPHTPTLLCCGSRSVKLYDTKTTEERVLSFGSEYSALVTPTGANLIVGVKDRAGGRFGWFSIGIRELGTGRALCTIHAKEAISAMALSPDGSELAVALPDHLDVFDGKTGRRLRSFKDEDHSFRQIEYRSNGNEIVGVAKQRLVIFNAQSGAVLKTIQTQPIWSRTLALSPDGKSAALGGWNNTIHVFDLELGVQRAPGGGHRAAIASVGISPDGKVAASGSEDATVRLWDLASGRELRTIESKGDDVMGVEFSSDGKRILAAGGVGTPDDKHTQSWLKAWNVSDGSPAGAWMGGDESAKAYGMAIVSANSVAVCERGAMRIWNTETGQCRVLKCPGWEAAAAEAGGGRWILSGDGLFAGDYENEYVLRLWDAASGRQVRVFKGAAADALGATRCIRVAPDQSSALVAFSSISGAPGPLTLLRFPASPDEKPPDKETIQAWISKLSSDTFDVRAEAARRLVALGPRAREWVKAAEHSPDGETRDSIRSILADYEQEELPLTQGLNGMAGAQTLEGDCEAVAYHPDSRHWAAVIENRNVREILFGEITEDRTDFKILRRIPADRNPTTLAFSPDGTLLLTGNADTTLSVYGR